LASTGKLLVRELTAGPHPEGANASAAHAFAHPLQLASFAANLDRHDPDLTATWSALASVSTSAARAPDWWPVGVPVLLALVEGGEGVTSDSGCRITSDRSLLRVTGYGGSP